MNITTFNNAIGTVYGLFINLTGFYDQFIKDHVHATLPPPDANGVVTRPVKSAIAIESGDKVYHFDSEAEFIKVIEAGIKAGQS